MPYLYKFMDNNKVLFSKSIFKIKKKQQLYFYRMSFFQCRSKHRFFLKSTFSNLSSMLIWKARLLRRVAFWRAELSLSYRAALFLLPCPLPFAYLGQLGTNCVPWTTRCPFFCIKYPFPGMDHYQPFANSGPLLEQFAYLGPLGTTWQPWTTKYPCQPYKTRCPLSGLDHQVTLPTLDHNILFAYLGLVGTFCRPWLLGTLCLAWTTSYHLTTLDY